MLLMQQLASRAAGPTQNLRPQSMATNKILASDNQLTYGASARWHVKWGTLMRPFHPLNSKARVRIFASK